VPEDPDKTETGKKKKQPAWSWPKSQIIILCWVSRVKWIFGSAILTNSVTIFTSQVLSRNFEFENCLKFSASFRNNSLFRNNSRILTQDEFLIGFSLWPLQERQLLSTIFCYYPSIGCPTPSVAQANLTIKINFNILRSFSSSDILTIYLHAFLQSLHPFEKTAFKISRGISARITRIQTRSSDGVSARYPISCPLT
jgi:hypothetical protein